jgi:hypothetical protein
MSASAALPVVAPKPTAAPFYLKATAIGSNCQGALGLYKRAGSDATKEDTGYALCQLGLLARESVEGYVLDVRIFDERHTKTDVAVTNVHRKAIRVLCGDDGLAALENMSVPRRMTTTAWLMTGGDTSRSAEGAAGFLHIITKQLDAQQNNNDCD